MGFKNGKIIIFSGAGISAESGIATFRDSNGLWANYDPMTICNYKNWLDNYELVHSFYDKRRKELKNATPNKAHKIVAKIQQKFDVINITQNVDDLFERAGCKDTIHLHGFLRELRCERCESITEIGYEPYDFSPCPKCNNDKLKPNIVFFYEQAPKYRDMYEIFDTINKNDIVVVIGTSGEVVNICGMLKNGYKILNNLNSADMINEDMFDSVYMESSVSALPKIYDEIVALKNKS